MDERARRRESDAAASSRDREYRRGEKGLKHGRKSKNRKRAGRESTKPRIAAARKSLNVDVYYGGDSSGYGSSVSVSGDELNERTKSGVPRLPPIASSPPLSPSVLSKTPDIRTRTASPFTPLTPLSPVKLSPAPSGRYRNRRSLLSLSTSTSSDSAFDSCSATSSRTSVKGHVLDHYYATASPRRSAHLEPPQAGWNRKCLSPISAGRPTVKKNLYLSDTKSNLTGREMYIQFSIPQLSSPQPPPQQQKHFPPFPSSSSKTGHLAMGAPLPPPHTLPPIQTPSSSSPVQQQTDVNGRHAHPVHTGQSWPRSSSGGSNLVLIGGSPPSVARSLEALRKAPLPAIGTPDLSSSNLHVCRSSEGSVAAVAAATAAVTVTVDPAQGEDSVEPLPPPEIAIRRQSMTATSSLLSLCSSGSSTPMSSSLLDIARCAGGMIPSINLIAPTPLPPGQSRPPSRSYSRVA
ncbi:probable LIM domain-containing serine/threonine-protein kinase DDB_G0286997 [Oscarella lobularis]|uniref:probable LIM domain-containing serine/threonine-protein kinase DDB_G0286997 n=1 Tax=Oscarella lobularis TaxID=121494 RepID=UPI00331333E2